MVDVVPWLSSNWFSLLQGVGIIAGLFFTGVSLRREAVSRRMNTLLALSQQHRELWGEVHRHPELGRVLAESADLLNQPITMAEQEFLNIVFVHFATGWEMMKRYRLVSEAAFRRDVTSFLSLPIPCHVWEKTKSLREPRFVRFVERCLKERRIGTA